MRRSPKIRGVFHIAWQREVFVAEAQNSRLIDFELGDDAPQFSGANEALSGQNAARQQAKDDQHDGEFDEREAMFHGAQYSMKSLKI